MFGQPKPKTFSSVLEDAETVITDLIEVADNANTKAKNQEDLATAMMIDAGNDRREAAKATIVSNRMASFINVSEEAILAELE